jgi:Mycothiol maleylpyruvate isomerase N-terminal domain
MSGQRPDPIEEFVTALGAAAPDAPTACTEWTAHEVAAHLAAGLEECNALIGDALAGRPTRDTRTFTEREAPYLALPDEELRLRLNEHLTLGLKVLDDFRTSGPDASVEFTGAAFTAAQMTVHIGSELAIHRWDLVGDDPIGQVLLSDPALTRHAVFTLNALPMLAEAPTNRVADTGLRDTTVVLRAVGEPDVALTVDQNGSARFESGDSECEVTGDLVITTDAVNRLLTFWGRHSSQREIAVTGNPAMWCAVATALWPDANDWPER